MSVTAAIPGNGGFEQNLPAWGNWYGGTGSIAQGGVAHSGTHGLTMGPNSNSEVAYQNLYGLTQGQQYTVSAWVKAAAATTTTVDLCLNDSANGHWACAPNTVPTTSWQQISTSFTTTGNEAMRIELSEATGSETTYWDDVTVTPSTVSGDPGTSFQPTYYPDTNRFKTLPSGTPSYDPNGSLLADGFHMYTWDANGHNISIDNNAAIMAYDALDRWVERANSAGHTQAVYAPDGNLLAVTNGQTLVHGYLAMPGGAMAHYTSSGLAEYWHPDWLGTPRLASTPGRAVSNDMSYAPYGEQYGGSAATTTTFFTGAAQALESTDLLSFPARNYQTTQGRWISPDPAGMSAVDLTNPQTLNRYAYVGNNPMSLTDPTGLCADANATSHDPQCQDGPWEQTNGALAYLGGFADPFQVSQIPVTITSYVPGQAPQPISLQFPSNATSATITFGTPPGSWQTVQVGTAGDYLDPSTYDVPVGIDIWKGQQQLWHNTAVVGNAAAAATGALVAAPVVADAASSLTLARLAVGPGRPWGIHFAVGVGGTWLHWIKDAVDDFGNIGPAITTEAAEAWAVRAAWFRIRVPILNPSGVLGTIGKPASNCLTGACYAIGQGWIP